MKTCYIFVCLSFLLVMTTGCIKENLDDCDNVTIYFQYLADGDEDVLYQYMDKVDLYVFDENEVLVEQKTYHKEELENFAAVPSFRLKQGKTYRVVALGNAYDHTKVVNLNSSDLDNIYIEDMNWDTSLPVHTHDHNYLGGKEFVMPAIDGIMHRDTVTLKSAHINVDIRITGVGLEDLVQDGDIPYSLRIENSNPQTSFMNLIETEEKGTCYPELVYDAEKNCLRTDQLVLFRFDNRGDMSTETCSHTLVLTNTETNEELLRQPLYSFLEKHPDTENEVLKQEANLALEIVVNNYDVEIKVPDWEIEETIPGWEN